MVNYMLDFRKVVYFSLLVTISRDVFMLQKKFKVNLSQFLALQDALNGVSCA